MKARYSQDLLSGAMFLGFGGVGLVMGRGLQVGIATQMGPGFFPLVLSIGVMIIGGILVLRGLIGVSADEIERIEWKPALLVLLSVVAFAATIERLGLVIALGLLTAIGSMASRNMRLVETLGLAVALIGFSVAVFVWALGLPVTVFPK